METIARFYKGEDAHLFRSYLESEGIVAHVLDEYTPQVNWAYTHVIGGIRVTAAPEDAEEARRIFEEYEERTTAGEPAVGDVKAWPFALLVTFLIGVPLMIFGRKLPMAEVGNP